MAKPEKHKIVSHIDILARQGNSNYLKEREKPTGKTAYATWLQRIQAAIQWRANHWNGDVNWRRAYKLYGGKHWKFQDEPDPSADEVRDLITVNVTMSVVNNMVPYLINSNPLFLCKPRKPSDNVSAMLQQEILNYEFQMQQMIDQIKEAVLDAAIIGHGICKTGFTFELDDAISEQSGSIIYEDYIKQETPFLCRVDPFCFIFDPTGSQRNLQTARWCGEVFHKYFDDVVENEAYRSSVRNKLKNGFYNPKLTTLTSGYGTTPDAEWDIGWNDNEDVGKFQPKIIKLFEIWDKKYKKRLVFADGVDDPLSEDDWPYDYLVGFPYRMLTFTKIPNEHYGVGIPYQIEDQQFELDRARTAMFQHRRRFNRKYEILDSVDEPERNKLEHGEDGTLVIVKQIGSVNPIADAPMSQDHYQTEAIIKGDVQELSGMDSLMRGGPLPSRTTGVEINTRTTVFRLKIDDLVDRSDKFVLQLGKDVNAHIKHNMVKERVVRVLGLQGEYWVNVVSEDILAEVDVSMESIAAPRTNPEQDKMQALQLFQLALQSQQQMAAQGLQVNLVELFKWLLEKFGYKDVGRFFMEALVPTAPLQEQPPPDSNNLNPGAAPVPSLNGTSPQVMNPEDLQKQVGIPTIMNANGLQGMSQ